MFSNVLCCTIMIHYVYIPCFGNPKGAGETVDIEDIKHITEEKELMGEKMKKLKEEWDSQRLSFYEQTKLDDLSATPKLLKNGESDEDDGFDELDRLLSQG